MTKLVLKNVCWFVLMIATSQCECQESKNLAMIYAIKGDVYVCNPYRNDIFPRKLTRFDQDVTGFAIHDNYLYISVKRTFWFTMDSAIWRVKILNSTNFQIDYDSWDRFHVMNNFFDDVLCMVIANGYVYAGRSDGIIWRCPVNKSIGCQDYNYFSGLVTSIDYNPIDHQIYALENLLFLERNSHFRRIHSLVRWVPETTDFIDLEYILVDKKDIKIVKTAFDAVWVGTGTGQLWICPSKLKIGSSLSIDKNCLKFDELEPSVSMYISASKKYLYVHLESSKYILRCDPTRTFSCTRLTHARMDMGSFIIH